MAKCEEETIVIVKCSPREKEAVLDVTGEPYWPLELSVEQWFAEFNDYAREDGACWDAATGVTEAIRSRMSTMEKEPGSIFFR